MVLKDGSDALFVGQAGQEKYYVFLIGSQEKHLHFLEKSLEGISDRMCMNPVCCTKLNFQALFRPNYSYPLYKKKKVMFIFVPFQPLNIEEEYKKRQDGKDLLNLIVIGMYDWRTKATTRMIVNENIPLLTTYLIIIDTTRYF